MSVSYEPLNVAGDSRGFVFEPVAALSLSDTKNVHVVISLPEAIRGNHIHRAGKETIAVVGPARVRFREEGEVTEVVIQGGEAYRFVFPPGVAHAIQNLSSQPNVLVAFTTAAHDPDHPDVEPDRLI